MGASAPAPATVTSARTASSAESPAFSAVTPRSTSWPTFADRDNVSAAESAGDEPASTSNAPAAEPLP